MYMYVYVCVYQEYVSSPIYFPSMQALIYFWGHALGKIVLFQIQYWWKWIGSYISFP